MELDDPPSEISQIEETLLDLLSEDDECIVLKKRPSRKTVWSNQKDKKKFERYPSSIKEHNNLSSDILIDNGYRSPNRQKLESPRQITREGNKRPISGILKSDRSKLGRNDISVSEDGLVHLLKLAVTDKSTIILRSLCGQLKKMDEKSKSRILNKLNFDDRLIVIKTMYTHPQKSSRIVASVVSPRTSRKSTENKAALTSPDNTKSLPRRPPESQKLRKSFSYLECTPRKSSPNYSEKKIALKANNDNNAISTRTASKSPMKHKSKSPNNDTQKYEQFQKMASQIHELQKQNNKLSTTLKTMITKNYKLEQQLEVDKIDNTKVLEMKNQIEQLTECHDYIIDNVYSAYSQLTRSLKSLKFNKRSSSVSRPMNTLHERASRLSERARSLSISPTPSRRHSPSRFENSSKDDELSSFINQRKSDLTEEYHETDLKLESIQRKLLIEPIGSASYKRRMLEKKLLQEHKETLRKMIESI